MSVSLTELKLTLENAVNAFVEQKLVLNQDLNIRSVDVEIVKLFETATRMTSHFKQFYAKNYKSEEPIQLDPLAYLAEYRAENCHKNESHIHYCSAIVDALYKKIPASQDEETLHTKGNILKTLCLKMENSKGEYQQGIQTATAIISGIKSSNLKAELYVLKHHAAKLIEAANLNDDPLARKSESSYANGLTAAVEIAEHMLPYKELTSDEILEQVKFPRPFFDFKGHDVVLNCPGLKQSVLFVNAILLVEEFCSANVELGQVTANGLKRPLLGHFGRDGDSIMKGFKEGKASIMTELNSNTYVTSERKLELHKNFIEMLGDVTHEMKVAFRRGALIPSHLKKTLEFSLA